MLPVSQIQPEGRGKGALRSVHMGGVNHGRGKDVEIFNTSTLVYNTFPLASQFHSPECDEKTDDQKKENFEISYT